MKSPAVPPSVEEVLGLDAYTAATRWRTIQALVWDAIDAHGNVFDDRMADLQEALALVSGQLDARKIAEEAAGVAFSIRTTNRAMADLRRQLAR